MVFKFPRGLLFLHVISLVVFCETSFSHPNDYLTSTRIRSQEQKHMRMDDRSTAIELRSISCKGVKLLFNLFQKPSLYALVSVTGQHNNSKKKTPIDRHGGENPEWDQSIRLDGVDPSLAINFELNARRILGDTTVGTAHIPVADLNLAPASVKHASYQVRGPDGRPNGVLTLSYKTDGPPDADTIKPEIAPPASFFNHEAVKYPDLWDNYPPRPPAAEQCYPPPPTDPAVSFVPLDREHQGWSAQPPPAYGGYYPPPPPQPGYYPPPACCYSGPRDPHGCRTEAWVHRGLYNR